MQNCGHCWLFISGSLFWEIGAGFSGEVTGKLDRVEFELIRAKRQKVENE